MYLKEQLTVVFHQEIINQLLMFIIVIHLMQTSDNDHLPTHHLQAIKKLNTFNLPDSSIVDGSENIDTAVTYTGNGTGQSITGVRIFRPDFTMD